MIKRKLLFIAVLFVLFTFGLLKTGTMNFLYEMPAENSYVSLSGILNQIENKTNSKNLYIENTYDENSKKKYGTVIIAVEDVVYDRLDLKLGSRIHAYVKYTGFNIARNAGNFDEANYYHSLGISGKFYLENTENLQRSSNYWNYLKQWLFEIKTEIVDTFDSVMKGYQKPAGIFSAIVAGEKSNLNQEIKELYQDNGIAHVLAISGLHISLIGMSIFSILRRRHGYLFSCVTSSLVMVGFCVMSGGSISAVRATIMFSVKMLAEIMGKTFDMLSALALAALLVVMDNPNILTNGAFQLSFSAILGISIIARIIENYYQCDNKLWNAFSVSLSVSLATLPIITSTYYEIPLYSVFLNLFIVPLMSFVLGSGIICGLAGAISVAIGRFVIGAGVYLLSLVEIICAVIDKIPFSIVVTGKPKNWQLYLFYFLLAAGLLYMKYASRNQKEGFKRKNKRVPLKKAAIVVIWSILLFLILIVHIPRNQMDLFFFDVGQGEGFLVQSPSGKNYLFDGGSSTINGLKEYRLESAMKYLGVDTLDYSIITHPDTDHISGVLGFIEDTSAGHIKIKNLVVADVNDNEKYDQLIKLAKSRGINVIKIHSGERIDDGNICLTCLHPTPEYSSKDSNGQSLVFLLEYSKFRALLTGDIGEEEEQRIRHENLKEIQLLKVAHHGSRTSSSQDFLQAIFQGADKKNAVISAGVHNLYGHPHIETLERLKQAGADIFCTAQTGEIKVSIDKKGQVKTKKYLLNF